jgi:hypothetical protein
MPTRGILIISCGNNHDAMAVRLINSLVKVQCPLPIHLHRAKRIGRWSREEKVNMCEITPFDQTLYLDCDILALRNPEPVLNNFLAGGPQVYATVDGSTPTALDMWNQPFYKKELSSFGIDELAKLPNQFLHFSTGMLAFTKDAWPLFTLWAENWLEDCNREPKQPPLDELHFMRAMRTIGQPIGELATQWCLPCNPEKTDSWIKMHMKKAVLLHLCGENKAASYARMAKLVQQYERQALSPAPAKNADKEPPCHSSKPETTDSSLLPGYIHRPGLGSPSRMEDQAASAPCSIPTVAH